MPRVSHKAPTCLPKSPLSRQAGSSGRPFRCLRGGRVGRRSTQTGFHRRMRARMRWRAVASERTCTGRLLLCKSPCARARSVIYLQGHISAPQPDQTCDLAPVASCPVLSSCPCLCLILYLSFSFPPNDGTKMSEPDLFA